MTEMRAELITHPVDTFADYLLNGLDMGFDPLVTPILVTPVPVTSVECSHNLSARKDPESVTSLIQTELDWGYIIGPYKHPPISPYRVSPLVQAVGK